MEKKKQNLKITITTKEHFNKYADFKKGINKDILLNLVWGLYADREELQAKFNQDIHLNNISMKAIDDKINEVAYILKGKIKEKGEDGKTYLYLSLAESCSFIKHILIYEVLQIKPYFEEDIKNYKEQYLKILKRVLK